MSEGVAFDPFADASALFPALADLEPGWRDRWSELFMAAVPEALAALRRSFGGAVDLHDVPGWLASPKIVHSLTEAGWVFAALDYFHWRATPVGDASVLHAYLQQRHLDCWRENAASLLEWLAVQQCVPEEWLPHALVERQLSARLGRQPTVARVVVRAEMRLNPPGGTQWLRDRSLPHWRAVSDRVAAGDCCPVVAFGSASPRALLAFRSGDQVHGYDPGDPDRVATIDPASVDGLLRLHYVPEKPPLSAPRRLAGAVGIGSVTWRLERAWRMFRHAAG